jgi:cell division protein ZapA
MAEIESTNSTTVEIMGREFRIRGSADAQYVREIARYVDDKLREVSQGSSAAVSERVVVLAALNIADELFQLKRASSEEMANIAKKAESLLTMLDENMSV